jgi:hypothetical protein
VKVATFQIGAARLTINLHGCIECGAENPSAWKAAQILGAVIGRKVIQFPVYRCAACAAPEPKQLELAANVGGS